MKENIKIINNVGANLRRDGGVYSIKCIPLNRIYIGSTDSTFRARFSNHNKFLKQGKLANVDLQADYNLYGSQAFEVEVLVVLPPGESVSREQAIIDQVKPFYNKQKARNNSKTNTGKKFSQEWKDKIREKAKLYKHEGEVKDYMVKMNKEGANKFKLTNIETKEEILLNSKLEVINFFKASKYIEHYYGKVYKGYSIEVLKTQRKEVVIYNDTERHEFNSYEKCDKFLNKWRGFTSTKSIKGITEFEGYKVIFK